MAQVEQDKMDTVKITMESLDAQYKLISGAGGCSAMTAGYRFEPFNHPYSDNDGQYVITKVTHEAEQNPTYNAPRKTKAAPVFQFFSS